MDKIRVMYRNPNALKGKGWKKIHGLTWGNLGKGEEESPFSRLDFLCQGDFKRTSFRRFELKCTRRDAMIQTGPWWTTT